MSEYMKYCISTPNFFPHHEHRERNCSDETTPPIAASFPCCPAVIGVVFPHDCRSRISQVSEPAIDAGDGEICVAMSPRRETWQGRGIHGTRLTSELSVVTRKLICHDRRLKVD